MSSLEAARIAGGMLIGKSKHRCSKEKDKLPNGILASDFHHVRTARCFRHDWRQTGGATINGLRTIL
jgi:hypothetical protein